MTTTRTLVPIISANEVFKSHYNNSLRWAGLAAVLCTAIMVWLSPQYAPQPYQMREQVMHLQDVEVIYDIPEPPQVAAAPILQPNLEAAENEDPEAVDTIDIATWEPFEPAVRFYDGGDAGFIPSSTKPSLISQAKPHYPEVARLAQVEGTVLVKVLVDVDGSVKAAEIITGVHPLLDKAALQAARRCVFSPGQQRERKVATWVAVPYRFRLR